MQQTGPQMVTYHVVTLMHHRDLMQYCLALLDDVRPGYLYIVTSCSTAWPCWMTCAPTTCIS